jgi:hypothetical protein
MKFESLDCLTDILNYETMLAHNLDNVNLSVLGLLCLIIRK